ncbi:T9SS type A sorting domain-containing protein [Segetibacter sp. 3557_3]|uniref:T9SS-dependent choice-of-anchor J family protein n=1 Tax=Segetibacter sp. 3557_3 TaxID=2547429 RepID=UPI0010583B60|nr:choice-of-anchor J domain-containing protein [Segetibacter sp. 3557_3]TDH18317.1 T9SS type A sorting domain-containing protein [Segetibacter sp. 3557_3]
MRVLTLITVFVLFVSFGSRLFGQVVVNEVYGGGGNSGSVYKNDFIELFNNGNISVDLTGWSVQYASATGAAWQLTPLSGSIAPKGYFLVKQAAGTGGTTDLPTPDATGTINMSGTAGKVALVSTNILLTGVCPPTSTIVDLIGFGNTANCFEGSAPAPAPSNTSSVERNPVGFDDNQNATNFIVAAPSPTASAPFTDSIPPEIASLYPSNNAGNSAARFTATITFNESIQKGSGTIKVIRQTDNTIVQELSVTTAAVAISGRTANFSVIGLDANTRYFVEVSPGAFKDLSGNDFTGVQGTATWLFTTGSLLYNAKFNYCASGIQEGFQQFNVLGAQTWACTTFGRDSMNLPSGSAQNGIQINGFEVTNVPNEDWLISPSFNLVNTIYPLFSFWSRTAFNGRPLQLKVSTDYSGSGNPALATWTDLNGRFPAQASDIWLQSIVNLSAYKQPAVYIAFVYTSGSEDGARWTLDDITIDNSMVPPAPNLTLSTKDLQFNYVAAGGSAIKSFLVTANDITTPLTLAVTGDFQLSQNNANFSSALTIGIASANNTAVPIYVKFSPSANDRDFTGILTVTTSGTNDTINLKGSSTDPAKTLEVVNWNIEWFGSPTFGPINDSLQEQNVKTIMLNIGADLFGLTEVVDTARLGRVVRAMPGYTFVVSDFGSHTNPTVPGNGPLSDAQKLAFVYKTGLFSNVTTGALLSQGTNTAADAASANYNNWSSGRYPYLMNADVNLGGITKNIKFILIHAKANTSPTITSYARRKDGADSLYKQLNTYYISDNIILFGDFNDDLDQTITAGINPPVTSYYSIVADSANYPALTLPLSRARKKSTAGFNDMIDHVIVSNEMRSFYINNSANVLSDVSTLVSAYASTTTDHFPIFTRYAFDQSVLSLGLISFTASKKLTEVELSWKTSVDDSNEAFVIQRSADATAFKDIGKVVGRNALTSREYTFTDKNPLFGTNYYRLRQTGPEGKVEYSKVLVEVFTSSFKATLGPNPTTGILRIDLNNNRRQLNFHVADMSGRIVARQTIPGFQKTATLNLKHLQKGSYVVKLFGDEGSFREILLLR